MCFFLQFEDALWHKGLPEMVKNLSWDPLISETGDPAIFLTGQGPWRIRDWGGVGIQF